MSVTHNLPDLGFDSYLLVSAELSEPVGYWRVLFVLNEDLLARWRKARFTVGDSGPHFLATDGLILAEGLSNPLYLDDAFGETYYTIQDSDSGEEELFDRLATDPFWWGWANDDHFREVDDASLFAHLEADGTIKLTATTDKVQVFATIPPDVSLGDDQGFLLMRTEREVEADAEAFFAEHPTVFYRYTLEIITEINPDEAEASTIVRDAEEGSDSIIVKADWSVVPEDEIGDEAEEFFFAWEEEE